MELFIAILGLYILLVVGISLWVGRSESKEDYLIAGRNRPWWQIAFSKYAVTIGAAWYVTYTAFAYEYGFNVITLLIGIAIGYLFFAYWGAKRIKRLSVEAGGFYTVGELVEYTTKNVHAGRLIHGVILVTTLLYLTVGVVAGGVLMESFGLISYELAVFLTFLVVIGYVLISGYKAVVITDIVQGIIMLGLLVLVVYGFLNVSEMPMTVALEARPIDILTILMFTIFGAATTFASPDRYQLSYAGSDEKSLKVGFTAAFIPVLLTALILMVIGSVMYVISPGLDGALVFPDAMTKFLTPSLVPFALVMFFAGLMSSADTGIYVLASHIQSIYSKVLTRDVIRKLVIVIGVLGFVVAFLFRDVVDLTILAAGIQTAMAFPMIYLVAGGKNNVRFVATVYGGLLGVVAGVVYFGLDPKAAAFVLGGNLIGALIPMSVLRTCIAKKH